MVGDRPGSWWRRWSGVLRFALTRTSRWARTAPRQTAATVGIVALTIALLVIVTGMSVALAEEPTIEGDADLRVVPQGGGTLSSVVDVEGPRLGSVHDRTAAIDARDDVEYATPVLTEIVRAAVPDTDRAEFVLAVGVVPGAESTTVAGVSTAAFDPGDPHYANGSYDGPRTNEVVLSRGAAARLEVDTGETVAVSSGAGEADRPESSGDRLGNTSVPTDSATGDGETGELTHTVIAVEDSATDELASEMPIAVVRLSELQSVTGADDGDLADQVLIGGRSSDVRSTIEERYPEAAVETAGDEGTSIREDDLALAVSLLAALVGVAICSLFVATASALTVEGERQLLAVLAAVGFTHRSRLVIVAVTTLVLTAIGAVLGLGLGFLGIGIVNAVATATVAPGPVAAGRPVFVPYGLGVALVAAIVALPYPLWLAARTNVLSELGR